MREDAWERLRHHLAAAPERFAFIFARWTHSQGKPVFTVVDVHLVPDEAITYGAAGYEVDAEVLIACVNRAVRSGEALIEAHSHGGRRPRFSSRIDRPGLAETTSYVLESLPGRPYAAMVFGEDHVYGEYWSADGSTGVVRSVTVTGSRLRQVVSRDDDMSPVSARFDRQLPWFGPDGQQQLGRLRFGVLGAGGTGSQVIQQLAYIGARDLMVVDPDSADQTSMNRLVTAMAADLGTAKVVLGRRLMLSVAPQARVEVMSASLLDPAVIDRIRGCDVIFSCVDDDGPRLVVSELAVAYDIPMFDLGVGITVDENGRVVEAGGRVATFIPGGPCPQCMGIIDHQEAGRYLKPADQRSLDERLGYVRGVPAPAVVSLNGMAASMATNELAVGLSGIRPIHPYLEFDLLGTGRALASQWLTPVRTARDPGCVLCAGAPQGDAIDLARYHRVREGIAA